jgi:hypothetical protein
MGSIHEREKISYQCPFNLSNTQRRIIFRKLVPLADCRAADWMVDTYKYKHFHPFFFYIFKSMKMYIMLEIQF